MSNLLSLLNKKNDTINPAEIVREVEKMNRLSAIRKEYKDKIKHRKDEDRVYVYINRKQITAHSEKELYEKIYNKMYAIEKYTIFKLFPMYIKYKQEHSAVKGLTLKKYINDFKKFFEPYKDDVLSKPFAELTTKDFIRLFSRWTGKREITLKQFNNLKSMINGIYSYVIVELDFDIHNKIREISTRQFSLKPVRLKDNAFTQEERQQILEELSKQEDAVSLALQFDFYCGLRIGELLALKYSDIEDGLLSVSGQYLRDVSINDDLTSTPFIYSNTDMIKGYTDKGYRKIPLNEQALSIIRKMRKLNPFGEYIFMQNGKQILSPTCSSRIRRICIQLGIRPRGTHAIRFTYASLLYLNGISVLNISKLLGHTSVTMTNRYVNDILPQAELNELIKKIL